MVRRLVLRARRYPVEALLLLILAGTVGLTVGLLRSAEAAYSTPLWTNASPSQETAIASVAELAMTPEGVDVRTGELFYDHEILSMPGLVQDNVVGLRWRSMLSGTTQMGAGVLPSFEITAEKVILNSGSPNAAGGHEVWIRRPSGRIDVFGWSSTVYAANAPDVFDSLTTNGSGNYVLTDKWGQFWTFDANGMPATWTDRNGNVDTYTYNSAKQITGYTDDRGKTYSFAHDATSKVLTSITDPASQTWSFGYDSADNLTTITTPITPDQTSGITTTLAYDTSGRLTSVTDGRGSTAFSVSYSGSTRKVSSITIDGHSVSFTYNSGQTTRTDRNGNVHRYWFTGNQVTKIDMLVSSASKYATNYYYSGVFPSYTVYPRGNRCDFTYDGAGNLTGKRERTADTSTNDSSDLVHAWTFTSNFMVTYTDPRGSQWSYGRDSAGNLTSVTNPTVTNPATQASSKSWTYNAAGQVTTATDEEGNDTDYTYHTTGSSIGLLQKKEVDPGTLDLETQYTYDSAGNIAMITDPRGNTWGHTWDSMRRLVTTLTPSSQQTMRRFNYDANGNCTTDEIQNLDRNGSVDSGNQWITTTYTYTLTNRVASKTEEVDSTHTRTTYFDYDYNQNLIRVTKPEGNKDKFEYNEKDWQVSLIKGETSGVESTWAYAYDENGNKVTETDARANDTLYEYDLFDRQTKVTNALGNYTSYEYDKNANVTAVKRKNSSNTELQRSSRAYDERNRLYQISNRYEDPSATYSDAVTTIARFKTGELQSVTNPRSKTTTWLMDAARRITKRTDAMGNELSNTTFDANGNLTAWSILEKDGASSITHTYQAVYDSHNRRIERKEIDRTNSSNVYSTTYGWDSRDNLTWVVNAEGNPTRYTYDGLSRLTMREQALTTGTTISDFTTAQVTQYGFDKNDRLTSHKDDANNTTTWAYDAQDRATSMTYPDSSAAAYEYDENGNVTEVTDPAGNVITDTYDALNRNTARSVSLASGWLDTTSESRAYDALDRMTSNADDDYLLEYTYGINGLSSTVYEEKQSFAAGSTYLRTATTKFDGAGNRTYLAYPTTLSLTYAFNDIDEVSSISDGTNTIGSFDYIGFRKKKTTFQSGATANLAYGGFREDVASVQHKKANNASILRMDYGYNKVHDRTYERFGASGSAGDAFAYDKLRRLTSAWMGSATPTTPTTVAYTTKIDYNYDDDGNRSSVVTTPYGSSASTSSYTTNSLNQYTVAGSATPSHDGNGNLSDNDTYKFKYNYKNLICEVRLSSNNNLVATYQYDALGRRVQKAVSGGATTRFVYSRLHQIATYSGTNVWQQNYVFGRGIDEPVMLEQADVTDYDADSNTSEVVRSFYHLNALGSVMEITDQSQNEVESYRYKPYGAPTITVGGVTQSDDVLGQHLGFTARYYDAESGLYDYRARAYDPATGRFLQRDPLGYVPGPALYTYCSDSPITRVDPLGLLSLDPRVDAWLDEEAWIEYQGYLKSHEKHQKEPNRNKAWWDWEWFYRVNIEHYRLRLDKAREGKGPPPRPLRLPRCLQPHDGAGVPDGRGR